MMPQVTKHLEQLKEARKNAQELMTRVQTLWIKHKATPKYEIGDMVWLEVVLPWLSSAELGSAEHGSSKLG